MSEHAVIRPRSIPAAVAAVILAGCIMAVYQPAGNTIESIGAGYEVAAIAWRGWMNSTGHRTHLLALNSFYREQTEYGVGYAWSRDSEYHDYWVVLIARPGC